MGLYGLTGFVMGFIAGMIANSYLLKGVPKSEMLKNRSMRLKYGGLNWGIALLGMVIGIALYNR